MRANVWVGALIVAAAVVLGCGSGGGQPPTTTPTTSKSPPECVPTTCEAQARGCGAVDDGCGATLDCGSCATGEQCTAAGACEAIPPSCTPKTCAELNASCGTKDNGCGGVLSCGTCASGQRCGAASTCETIPVNCTPTTCAAQNSTCGSTADGCGGTLNCGSCAEGSACGVDHACHATAPAGGSTAWTVIRPTPILKVSGDLSGTLFTIGRYEGGNGGLVEKLSSSGAFTTKYETNLILYELLANQTADQVLFSGQDPHIGPPQSYAKSLSKALTAEKFVDGALDYSYVPLLGASSTGSVAVFHNENAAHSFRVKNPDGSTAFQKYVEGWWIRGAGFDANGNVLFAGDIYGRVTVDGLTFGKDGQLSPIVLKATPAGTLLWARTLDTAGSVIAFGVTTAGTGVALVKHDGPLSFAGASVSGGAGLSLVVYENSGDERVGTLVTNSGIKRTFLAVDPMGRAFVAYGNAGCDSTTVVKLNLAGAKEWTRTLNGIPACDDIGTSSSGLTVSNHAAVLSGYFDKTFDFGSGAVTPQGTDGFLMELRP